MNIKFVLKYLLLGILTSTIIFSVVNFSNYYFMNRYPYASDLYNEAFKLYNAGVLEKISWTKLFHRFGASESTQITVFGEQNKNFEDKLVLDYIALSKDHMLYKSNYEDNNYLFNFSDGRLVISIFSR